MMLARKMKMKKKKKKPIEMRIWISDDIKSELRLDWRSKRLSISIEALRGGPTGRGSLMQIQ